MTSMARAATHCLAIRAKTSSVHASSVAPKTVHTHSGGHRSYRLRTSAPGTQPALSPVIRAECVREAHDYQVRSGRPTDSPALT